MYKPAVAVLLAFLVSSCNGQTKGDKMENGSIKSNPLICDTIEGFCEIPGSGVKAGINVQKTEKPVKLIYFTDPICSSCWGIEPQLRKLKLEYGEALQIEYRMGGLLPDWSYNSGGISKPSDVAHHWNEVSSYYDMPIDGDVWLEDPLASSHPPSIAYKAAELQDKEKALLFLREIREKVFLRKKNIAKWEHIESAAKKVGLNTVQLQSDIAGKAKIMFDEDLKLAGEMGVRGFPTMFFISNSGEKEIVYGSKPYEKYEQAILKLYPKVKKGGYKKTAEDLFLVYHTLTAKEFSVLSDNPRKESEVILNELTLKNKLEKLNTKNGSLWSIKNLGR